MNLFPKLGHERVLTTLALGVGALVAVAESALFGWLLDRPIGFPALDALLMNTILVAVPFLLLSSRGSTRLLPWIAGLAVTLWLRWHALQQGVAYQRAPDGSGVDMGLGLLMLVSPAFIAVICIAIDEMLRRRASGDD